MASSGCNGVALTVQLSTSWAGNDGNWSTFSIAVGTPPQNFSVLPSIIGSETWIPAIEGCSWTSAPPACAASRGVGLLNGVQSTGFQPNSSSTWDLLGLYGLTFGDNLFNDSNSGLYGLDNIILGQSASQGFQISNQTVAGIATTDFWLGSFGVGVTTGTFQGINGDVPSLLSSMKSSNLTPSLSFGYNAGASYRSSDASLVFGGFDQALFDSDTVVYPINGTDEAQLAVTLQGIIATNTLQGTMSAPIGSDGLILGLDSSVSELWLPEPVCDSFAAAFGLIYENNTELYVFNSSTRPQLLNSNPELTFTLTSGDATVHINFPFSAFDLQMGFPAYENSTPYFPIRRTANESQYVLGRTFLQEAYIAVDWERQNFTIGQSSHQSGLPQQLTSICPPSAPKQPSSAGLSHGAIAGIVVGAVVALALLGTAGWFAWRRWKAKSDAANSRTKGLAELGEDEKANVEIMSSPVFEMHSRPAEQHLDSTPIYELPAYETQTELAAEPK